MLFRPNSKSLFLTVKYHIKCILYGVCGILHWVCCKKQKSGYTGVRLNKDKWRGEKGYQETNLKRCNPHPQKKINSSKYSNSANRLFGLDVGTHGNF